MQRSMDQSMTVDGANRTSHAELTLRSRMAELSLVPPWIEQLGAEHAISASTQFAMNLCLEEVLSNIIRHGYGNNGDRVISVRYAPSQNNSVLLVIDDEAPHFNPLAAEETPVEETLDGTRIGGLGIRLVRGFAESLKYEPTAAGNRLIIGFSTADQPRPASLLCDPPQ
ncbi:MAG: ATP-binding protein [Candidatus Acidiferrales bacterium]